MVEIARGTSRVKPWNEYRGLSYDTKPEGAPTGSSFLEIDTGNISYCNNGVWLTSASKFPKSLAITNIPTQYEGSAFDDTGMVATVTYQDDTIDTVEVINDVPEVFGTSKVTVTFTYKESGEVVTVQAEITPTAKALSSIAVKTAPTKVAYLAGEVLDLTGIKIEATYNSGVKEDVTALCTFTPAEGTVLATTDTEVVAKYVYREVEKTATQAITVTEE